MNTTRASNTKEFESPPVHPMGLVKEWFEHALANNVREPGAIAFATVDTEGRAFNRIVQILDIRASGLVFTTHAESPKGRQLASNSWASGVFYWRETGRQLIVSGPTRPISDEESDALWAARAVGTRPMSSVSEQSEALLNEGRLRAQAARLSSSDKFLPRPKAWLGYQLEPSTVEFWQAAPDRLHHRLRYSRIDGGWRTDRLQP